IAGLDMNYLGEPFGCIPNLLAKADYITKLHAICMQCGSIAQHTYRKQNMGKAQIILGAKDKYEARCRSCFIEGMKEQEYANP
ncbi:MAG: thymidine kinase, partial [Chitinophagaceae bacterium]